MLSTVPQLLLALGLAHLLNYRMRGRTFFRVAMLMPYATSVAAATLVFAQLFGRDAGLINWLLGVVGVNPVDWRNGNWAAQIAISSIIIWRWTGYNALIYLAGMQSIPPDLYEAAALDGANALAAVPARDAAGAAAHDPVHHRRLDDRRDPGLRRAADLRRRRGRGGALGQYQTLGLFLYQQGWQIGQLGRAAAVAWVMFLMIVVLVLVNCRAGPPPGACGVTVFALIARRARTACSSAGPRTYAALTATALVFLLPFYYLVVAASRPMAEMAQSPPPLTPGPLLFSNIAKALDQQNIGLALVNSLVVSGVITLGTVLLCTLAGFAFAKLRFRGRGPLFALAVGTMMIPPQPGRGAALQPHGRARPGGLAGVGGPAVAGGGVRGVLHAPVPRCRRCPTS